ncbi:MAG: hypothetical protein ACRDSF_15645 [Pseudonocardiaceae bacterium]
MSAPHCDCIHLLEATGDALAEGHRYGTYPALCGALLRRCDLPPALCPEDCEADCPRYCPECTVEAGRRVGVWVMTSG